ncbi:MAG TPA: fasciclin domain-containing protein [Gaiellaceae bacterium]|nr:fasciclin domain-containing protein [Gaiellaceae bacterium]
MTARERRGARAGPFRCRRRFRRSRRAIVDEPGEAEAEGEHRPDGGRCRPVQDARGAAQVCWAGVHAPGKGPYTVFAPTDAAFAKVPKSTLAALGRDKAALRSVLLYHVARGKVPAAKVVEVKSVRTLNGQSVRIRVSKGSVFVGGARVTTPDVMASNGVVHVINKVLIPPAR